MLRIERKEEDEKEKNEEEGEEEEKEEDVQIGIPLKGWIWTVRQTSLGNEI